MHTQRCHIRDPFDPHPPFCFSACTCVTQADVVELTRRCNRFREDNSSLVVSGTCTKCVLAVCLLLLEVLRGDFGEQL
jgi:hypothetical protein